MPIFGQMEAIFSRAESSVRTEGDFLAVITTMPLAALIAMEVEPWETAARACSI